MRMLPRTSDIKVRRRRLGLTQAQLARESGVSQSLIAKIESDSIDASYSNTVNIFDALERLERKETVSAGEMMSCRLSFAKPDDKVSKAIKLMKDKGISQLPVLDQNHPVGSISDKTILEKLASGTDASELSGLTVQEVMGDSFPIIDESTPFQVVSSLLSYNLAALVQKRGKIVGIITKSDLLAVVSK